VLKRFYNVLNVSIFPRFSNVLKRFLLFSPTFHTSCTSLQVGMATGDRDRPAAASGDAAQSFDCTVKELKELMQLRGAEAHQEIRAKYDSVAGLCSRLNTHPGRGKSI